MEQLSTEEGCPEEEEVRKRGKKTAKMLFFNIFLIENALLQVHYDFPNAYRY